MKRLAKKQKWGPFLALLLLLCLAGVAAADPYVGGIPLETVKTGVVSGGVYVDASLDTFGPRDVTKTFASIPDISNISWARLYVAVYCGHMVNNYNGSATVTWDGNGDETFETTLGTEELNVPYTWPGEGGSGPVIINDHLNRVTSDYLMWYDVTSLVTSQTPKARVVTEPFEGSSFDGRIKMITLVVAYNDGDTDQVYYWVNQGHDTVTYYDTTGYIGSTNFNLSSFSGTVESATLTVNHMANSDGTYAWYGSPIDSDPATGNFQGSYFGYNIWDLTGNTSPGDTYDLTYTRTANYYKIPLAVLEVNMTPSYVTPVADFSATPLSGTAPLQVEFTDLSTGPPTSWKWEYRYKPSGGSWGSYTPFSTAQHPQYTFSNAGDYIIRLTVTNPVGNSNKVLGSTSSPYITVSVPANPDLIITNIQPGANTPFARETNTVKVTVKNIGGSASPATTLNLTASDGFTASDLPVPALASSGETEISVVDTTIRNLAGDSLTYTATVDPDNTVTESDETNNADSRTYTVTYNGYKGKRYWAGQSDVTTKRTFDLNGGILYSFGDSTYKPGGVGGASWNDYTVTWTAADLPIPEGATVKEARLFVPYTWDDTNEVPDHFRITFNGNVIPYEAWYNDKSNFGGYANHVYGLLAYNVTDYFSTGGNNAIVHKDNATTNLAMYGLTLAVVYEKAGEPRRQIFLNEGFDILGADDTGYATTPEEATAYLPFSEMVLAPGNATHAYLTTFVPAGNGPEGDLLWNGATVATNVWDYGSSSGTQVAVDTRDVKTSLLASGNEAGIRSTPGSTPLMAASHAFLVVEYPIEQASIEVTLDPASVSLGTMIAGQDATNSTTVKVVASGGSSWSVSASDGKTTNKGYMVNGTTALANPIQLRKDGSNYQALTSDYTNFMSGTTMGSFSATASLKQPVASGDATGDYAITITFTGSIS